jgi:chromosomal replication initiator protein
MTPETTNTLELNESGNETNSFDAEIYRLNSSYTFDNLFSGDTNKLTISVAKSVADEPATRYNPLFIYGAEGVGKSHLLNAIGNQISSNNPELKVICCSANQFLLALIDHLRNKSMDKFRDFFGSTDVLLIDRVDFISGKTGTQEEILHTVKRLLGLNKRIVFTANTKQKKKTEWNKELLSFINSGVIVELKAPDAESKKAIIKNKTKQLNIVLSDEIINFIISKNIDNISIINGMLAKVSAYCKMINSSLTLKTVEGLLKDYQ